MRTTITRRLTQSTIHAVQVDIVDGAPVTKAVEPITVFGNIDTIKAKKIVDDKFGKNCNIVVAKVESKEKQFEISVDDFVKYAKPVEEKPDTDAQTETEPTAIAN